jgi:hypothetical protein
MLEQAVCEASCGGPNIGSHQSGHIDIEALQRRVQFLAPPARKPWTSLKRQIGIDGYPDPRFVGQLPGYRHETGTNQPLSLCAAWRQSTFYQKNVQSLPRSFFRHVAL